MKRFFQTLLALLIIFLVIRQIPAWLAESAGHDFTPYNGNLEGARILHHRNMVKKIDHMSYDFILAGTSRVMSDFSPAIIASSFHQACNDNSDLSGKNLGNIANYYVEFEQLLPQLPKHKVLILEFSPHMLLGGTDEYNDRHNFDYFRTYRRYITKMEYWLTGYFQKLIHFEERLILSPRMILAFINRYIKNSINTERLLLINRMNSGYGQILQEDGQIFYYTYIPDAKTGKTLRKNRSEYNVYKNKVLKAPFSQERFDAFMRIADTHEKMVVVRPPIAKELYALENLLVKEKISMVVEGLSQRGITYIDMNPHHWYSTDMSHIDWYDTKEVSKNLGKRLCSVYREKQLR